MATDAGRAGVAESLGAIDGVHWSRTAWEVGGGVVEADYVTAPPELADDVASLLGGRWERIPHGPRMLLIRLVPAGAALLKAFCQSPLDGLG